MSYFKKILLIFAVIAVGGYLVAAATLLNRRPADQKCTGLEFLPRDTAFAGFISQCEVESLLKSEGLYPVGKPLSDVRTAEMERVLDSHPLVDRVECYVTLGGRVCVEVFQRVPVLRVFTASGDSYCVDNKGTAMPSSVRCSARLPIATGDVEKSFAARDLCKFALFLQQNPFWEAQVEQIHVLPKGDVELVPRVGNHVVYLGRLDGYEHKLARLKEFYEKGLSRVGWDKYSRISVEFDNQVICTKRRP